MTKASKELPVSQQCGTMNNLSWLDVTTTKRSPYASHIVSIFFGKEQCLQIHADFLRSSAVLTARCCPSFAGGTSLKNLYFDDISIDAGHVIIHFLTTGVYSCLEAQGGLISEEKSSEFATALRVCAAAESLELPTLRTLATIEAKRLGEALDVLSILRLTHDLNSVPAEITSYIAFRVKEFCEKQTEATATMFLFEVTTPKTVSELLFKSMVELKVQQLSSKATLRASDMRTEAAVAAQTLDGSGKTDAKLHFGKLWEKPEAASFTEQRTSDSQGQSVSFRQKQLNHQEETSGLDVANKRKKNAIDWNNYLNSWPINKEFTKRWDKRELENKKGVAGDLPGLVAGPDYSSGRAAKFTTFWERNPDSANIMPADLPVLPSPEADTPPELTEHSTDIESDCSDMFENLLDKRGRRLCAKCDNRL